MHIRLFIILAFIVLGCQPYQAQKESFVEFLSQGPQCKNNSSSPKAIYDEDNRLDWWQVQGLPKNYWAASTVALISRSRLQATADGFVIEGRPYGESRGLCQDTAFYDQPQAAFCSGFLVAENIVVTAGHCLLDLEDCQNTVFVFDFAKRNSEQQDYKVRDRDVYSCKQILVKDDADDFAVIELKRKVVDRTPLNIRREGVVSKDDSLVLIGHPSGLPSKVADGGRIFSVGEKEIFAGVDAFAGNSGSVVINQSSGLVEGILVAGEPDFVFDLDNSCQKEFRCEGEGCVGEVITPIALLKAHIPNKVYEPPALDCSP